MSRPALTLLDEVSLLESALNALLESCPCKDKQLLVQGWRMYMYLRRLYHHLDVAFEKDLSSFDLTPAQYIALITIMLNEGISMSKLAELCLWNRSTASRITHTLRKKKLVTISAVDGKTSALKVTPEGQSLAAHYIAKEFEEFKHSLLLIIDLAQQSNNVYDWLSKSVGSLVSKETVSYVENTCQQINGATST